MKFIHIIKGDFEHTKWMLEEDKLTLGTYNVQDIPIREIVAVEKKEIIKKDYYIAFELGSGQTFTAIMKEKTYNHVYKAFISKGNHPTNIHLPIKSKSKANVIWACAGLAILALFMSGGNSNDSGGASQSNEAPRTKLEACNYLTKSNLPTGDWKERYGEYSCNSQYYDVDASSGNSLPNNIAYYVQGTSAAIWDTLKVVGNVNTPDDRDEFNHVFNDTIRALVSALAGGPMEIFVNSDFIITIDAGIIDDPIRFGDVNYGGSNHPIFFSGKKVMWNNSEGGFEYQIIIEQRK